MTNINNELTREEIILLKTQEKLEFTQLVQSLEDTIALSPNALCPVFVEFPIDSCYVARIRSIFQEKGWKTETHTSRELSLLDRTNLVFFPYKDRENKIVSKPKEIKELIKTESSKEEVLHYETVETTF